MDLPTSFLGWVSLIWENYSGMFLYGTLITLVIAISGTILGSLIGFVVGIVQGIPVESGSSTLRRVVVKILNIIISIYVEIFRGTPMMVQAVVVFYGSMQLFNLDMPPLAAGILVLSLNTGAYFAESVRGAITGIDPGQTEGAKAIGMTHFQTMLYVIIPQAFRTLIPQIGNAFVSAIKDTSVLNVITVSELYFAGRTACGVYFRYFETYFIIALIYLILTFVMSRLLKLLEKRMDGSRNYELLEEGEV
ncbi:MAG: amino acid ABC transporter permease [Lachnospiraceae bacterium]|nr:amino acid ABC transporter permease [Lachnospiraceae bacterium]MCI9149061.1 amino acid ABC transporter permease [Lachnospiraceae bacterium]